MLAAANRILTASGYQTITDLDTAAVVFEAIGLNPLQNLKVTAPQETLAQNTNNITMVDGTVHIATDTQEWLVMSDTATREVSWVATSALQATDLLVKYVTDVMDNVDIHQTANDIRTSGFVLVEVESVAAGAQLAAYDFAAFDAPMNAIIVNGGYVTRMKGAVLSTFVVDNDTPAVDDVITATLTLLAPIPVHTQATGIRSINFPVTSTASKLSHDAYITVREGATTGTMSVTAVAAGASNFTVAYTLDGVADTVVEVVTPA